MDDKSANNPVNADIEMDAIQKHVEESLLFLDDKKTASSDSENKDENIVNDPTKDLCKSNDNNEKSGVLVETSMISPGMDNKSSLGQAQILTEGSQTSTDNLDEMNEEDSQNNENSELTETASSQKILEETANESDETATEFDKRDGETRTTNTLSAHNESLSTIKQTVTDNPNKMVECENNEPQISKEVDDPTDEGQGSSVHPENVEQTGDDIDDPKNIVDNIQEMDVTDSNINEDENLTNQQKIVWEHPVWEPVLVKNEIMNEDETNSAEILEASIDKPINNDQVIPSDDEIEIFVPDMETITLDDNSKLESTPAIEETSAENQEKVYEVHKVTAKRKHVWESRVNDVNEDVIKKEKIDSGQSIAIKNEPDLTEISQESVDEVTYNENSGHIDTPRDVPLHENMTEKGKNSQQISTSSENKSIPTKSSHLQSSKTHYICTPAKRARVESVSSKETADKSNTHEPVKSAYSASSHIEDVTQKPQEISLYKMEENGQKAHDRKSTSSHSSSNKIQYVCTPAKRARIEPDCSPDKDTVDTESSEPGQSSSTLVEDLTVDSDDEVKLSAPAHMTESDYKEFADWSAKYLIKSKSKHIYIPRIFKVAEKHNRCVMRFGNLPKGYKYQDVYELIKRTTKHAGTDICKSIAFIYTDKDKDTPFNIAYVKWQDKDYMMVVKAMELFRLAFVKLQGYAVTHKYDDRSIVDWNVNDRPIIRNKSVPTTSILQPVLPSPFVSGEVNYYDKKVYGLSKEFLDSLDIKPPLSCFVTVKNLDNKLDEIQVRNIFSIAGTISKLILEPEEDKLNARIEYDHPLEAVQAISMFDKQELHKKVLNISMDDSMPMQDIIPEGFTKLGPGIGKDGNVLKGISVNNDIDQLKHSMYVGLKTLKLTVSSATGKVREALKAQSKINAEEENRSTQSTKEPAVQDTQSTQQSPQDIISTLATAISNSVQSNLMNALGFQPYPQGFTDQNQMTNCVNWSNPNAFDWTNMQTWMMQTGQNMQTWPNMQTWQNMQTGQDIQTGTNMQTGLNMQIGSNIQTGPNITTRPNMQSITSPNMQTPQNKQLNMQTPYNQTASNMQTPFNQTPIVQTRPSMQGALNMPKEQILSTTTLAPLRTIEQTGPNMEQTAYMHMQKSYMQTTQNKQSKTTVQSGTSSYQATKPVNPSGANQITKIQPLSENISIPSKPIPKKPEASASEIQSAPILYGNPIHKLPIIPSTTQKPITEAKKNPDLTVKPMSMKRDANGQSVSQVKPQVTSIPKANSPPKEAHWINKQIKAMRRNSKSPERSRTTSPKYNRFKEGNRSRDRSRERESDKQKEVERRREAEKTKEKQREIEKQREVERIKDKLREAEKLKEKQREAEKLKEKQKEIEKKREAERIKEKQRDIERHRDAERTKEKQRDSDRYRESEYTRSARPLFFKHLPSSVSNEDLREKMGEIGKIVSAQVLGKGYAVVTYRHTEDAEQCIEMYHLSKVDGQTIEVKWK